MKKRYGTWFLVCLIFLVLSVWTHTVEAHAKKKVYSLAKASIKLNKTVYVYSGSEKKPSVTVMLRKKKLKAGKDYSVSYKNNKKPGKATVTIKAKNKKKYRGSKKIKYTIQKATRILTPGKTAYSAVEGDGSFQITGKLSKGKGDILYSCASKDVIRVTDDGKVTVVKSGTATVKMKAYATELYSSASATVKVSVEKKPVRVVDADAAVKNYIYPVLNYACSNFCLTDFAWTTENKYIIPGLGPTAEDDLIQEYVKCGNLCPQGICMAGDYLLTTAYCMDDIHESCVFVYDRENGTYLNTIILTQKSHVGGITYDGGDTEDGNVWICHSESNKLQRIPYSALKTHVTGSKTCVNYKPDELVMSDEDGYHGVANKPSAIAYNPKDGYLWVTEFLTRDAGREATMAAYEYRDGELCEVSKYLHSAEEDCLGVVTTDPEDEELEVAGVSGGAIVVSVVTEKEGSNGEAALEEGDLITKIGDSEIFGSDSLAKALGEVKEGDRIPLEGVRVLEDGSVTTIFDYITAEKRSTKSAVRTIPYYVQGVTFTESGKAVFSRSWGRNQTKNQFISELMVFQATWNRDEMWDPDEIWEEEMAVALPPMAEEVEMNGNELYILFESAAMTYLEGTDGKGTSDCPIDKIISVDLGI